METIQQELFAKKTEWVQKNCQVPGDIPYELYNESYRVPAVIKNGVKPEYIDTIKYTLFAVDYVVWIQDFKDIWSLSFKDLWEKSYKGGRYINIHKQDVDEEGNTFVDFNLSSNLMCAYAPFFSCGIPPNSFPVAIAAGEIFVPEWLNRWVKKDVSLDSDGI